MSMRRRTNLWRAVGQTTTKLVQWMGCIYCVQLKPSPDVRLFFTCQRVVGKLTRVPCKDCWQLSTNTENPGIHDLDLHPITLLRCADSEQCIPHVAPESSQICQSLYVDARQVDLRCICIEIVDIEFGIADMISNTAPARDLAIQEVDGPKQSLPQQDVIRGSCWPSFFVMQANRCSQTPCDECSLRGTTKFLIVQEVGSCETLRSDRVQIQRLVLGNPLYSTAAMLVFLPAGPCVTVARTFVRVYALGHGQHEASQCNRG